MVLAFAEFKILFSAVNKFRRHLFLTSTVFDVKHCFRRKTLTSKQIDVTIFWRHKFWRQNIDVEKSWRQTNRRRNFLTSKSFDVNKNLKSNKFDVKHFWRQKFWTSKIWTTKHFDVNMFWRRTCLTSTNIWCYKLLTSTKNWHQNT